MRSLILTLETVGDEWHSLGEEVQTALSSWIARGVYTEAEQIKLKRHVIDRLGYSPYTGKISALSLFDIALGTGVIYHTDMRLPEEFAWGRCTYKRRTEYELLEDFWEGITTYDRVVTFHGERVAIPFLQMRSVAQRITPTVAFTRIQAVIPREIAHVDLAVVYGKGRRGKVSLQVVAHGMGVLPESLLQLEDSSILDREDALTARLSMIQFDTLRIVGLFELWERYLRGI